MLVGVVSGFGGTVSFDRSVTVLAGGAETGIVDVDGGGSPVFNPGDVGSTLTPTAWSVQPNPGETVTLTASAIVALEPTDPVFAFADSTCVAT